MLGYNFFPFYDVVFGNLIWVFTQYISFVRSTLHRGRIQKIKKIGTLLERSMRTAPMHVDVLCPRIESLCLVYLEILHRPPKMT